MGGLRGVGGDWGHGRGDEVGDCGNVGGGEAGVGVEHEGVSGKRTIRLEGDDGPIPHFNFGWSVLAEKEERQKTKIGAFSTVTGIGARKPGRTGPQGQAPPNVKVSPQKGKFRAYG